MSEVRAALANRRALLALVASTVLISGNWYLFIWAVNEGHITQASLGYYINPLVNVVLARAFLGERLRPLQRLAVAVALAGVSFFTLGVGTFPWVSLTLAASFGLYGLLRKTAPVGPLAGLFVETAWAAPFAAWLLGSLTVADRTPLFGSGPRDALFLLGSGVATALPLLWFAAGARRLRYSTMGILQYIAPTCQLALAVWVYGEPFTLRHGITFALIWLAVGLYVADGIRTVRGAAPAPNAALTAEDRPARIARCR